MLRFFVIFIVLQFGLFGVNILGVVQQYVVLPWTASLAQLCAWLVTSFDPAAASMGKVLWNTQNGFGVSIEPGCNGIEACIVLFAAVMAFPSTWFQKVWGVLLGFVAIQALNVVRVISLFYLGQWDMQVFNFAHEYLWQALIMLDVLVVWVVWVRSTRPRQAVLPEGVPAEGVAA